MMNAVISDVEKLNYNTVTIRFPFKQEVKPGQFLMVWVPGFGEIPISFSHVEGNKGITVRSYGVASEALIKYEKGQRLFFRGPYGKPFTPIKGRKLIVGGGSGMAGLLPLVDDESFGIVSARTERDLLFADRFSRDQVLTVTDDGSSGMKGITVDGLRTVDLHDYSMIYVCGPELMLKSILDYLGDKSTPAEFSLERPMKCGIGICDSCSIGGMQLCTEGPTISKERLLDLEEFGMSRLNEAGKRVPLNRH